MFDRYNIVDESDVSGAAEKLENYFAQLQGCASGETQEGEVTATRTATARVNRMCGNLK